MQDLMFKATDKSAWDSFAESFPVDAQLLVDEIGPIVTTPSVYAGETLITPAVMDLAHHVNVRVLRPFVMSKDEIPVEIDFCAVLAIGGPGVTWIDPATVNNPRRVWAGGMSYWKPAE